MGWLTEVEKIAHLTIHPELQLLCAHAKGIIYKLTEGMHWSSIKQTVKKRLYQVFSPVATKCILPPEYNLGLKQLLKPYKNIFRDSRILLFRQLYFHKVSGDHCFSFDIYLRKKLKKQVAGS